MRAWRVFLTAVLAVLAALVIGQAPASANAAGNYAQPNVSFSCDAPITGATELAGYIDVHFTHFSDHSEQPYGTYVTFTYVSGYLTGLGHIDTDARKSTESTWHHVDTSYFDLKYGPWTNGWLFDYSAPRSAVDAVRWSITYEMTDGTFHTCHVPSNWTVGAGVNLP
jgi:hypothetical protein